MAKVAKLSDKAKEVLAFIKAYDGDAPLTFSAIKASVDGANPSQLTALAKRGLVGAEMTEVTEVVEVTRTVNVYNFIKDEDEGA